MAFILSLTQISEIIHPLSSSLSSILSDKLALGISTDTRSLLPGEVFLALKGETFDGHNFLTQAEKQGAIALITQNDYTSVETFKHIPQYKVADTLVAYQKLAKHWRQKFTCPVIGVTGSVGKTTTKELIASVLGNWGKVHKTEGNYNNEIGVPKTLLQLSEDHNFAVIEMAMRASGEIRQLTEITQPTIGVITNVGTAHIGRLGSEEAIASSKCELLSTMSDQAIAILNHDSPLLVPTAKTVWSGETITYGLEGGDIQGRLIDEKTLRVLGLDFPLPLPGRHHALNYLAAITVASVLNLDLQPLTQGISVTLPAGRAKTYQLQPDIIILDETYNAGLESMKASLELLKDTKGKRKIAVLGAMKELGTRSPHYHTQVGEAVKNLGIDLLLISLQEPEAIAITLGAKGIPTETFHNHQQLQCFLKENLTEGDRVLFKASHAVGLTKVVESLLS